MCWFCISSHVHGEDITDFSHEGKHRLNAFGGLKFDETFFFSPGRLMGVFYSVVDTFVGVE